MPITKQLELQLAARRDQYSDFGSTFNPKIGFLSQPTSTVMLRGSANTGFRAPTLDDSIDPRALHVGNSPLWLEENTCLAPSHSA